MSLASGSSATENIAKAVALKEEGNAAFKAGDYKGAMVAYHQIYMFVHGFSASSGSNPLGLPGQTTTPVTEAEMLQIKELKLAHYSNLAMCHMKMVPPNLVKARLECTKALALDEGNVKALFRRGKCNVALGNLDEAKDDLDRVLAMQPDNKDAVRELRTLKGHFAVHKKKEAKKFAGMFERLSVGSEDDPSPADAAAGGAPTGGPSAGGSRGSPDSAGGLSGDPAARMPELSAGAEPDDGPSPPIPPPKGKAKGDGGYRAQILPPADGGGGHSVKISRAQGGSTAGGGGSAADDDIGTPLGPPQPFEPSDVSYGMRS